MKARQTKSSLKVLESICPLRILWIETIIVKMVVLDVTSEGKKHADFWHKLSKNVDASKAIRR